jgi:hypothetical protein
MERLIKITFVVLVSVLATTGVTVGSAAPRGRGTRPTSSR